MAGPHPFRQRLPIQSEFGAADKDKLGEFAEMSIPFPLGSVLRVALFFFGDDFIDAVSDR